MTQTTPHHLVQFATRHAISELKTFNAFAALFRVQDLISDAERLLDLQKHVKGTEHEFGSYRRTYEILSYFAVGFVTCLEWHARSRLVDLLSYMPSCIDKKDLDQIKSDALSQMMAHNVTVAHLIGANKTISRADQYVLDVFERLFKALSIPAHIERELRDTKMGMDLADHTNLYAALEGLFEFRNRLVHEIDIALVGPYTIRDAWSPDIAIEYGNSVIKVITLIEGHITKHGPKDFPNRLNSDAYPEDEFEKLQQSVLLLEDDISAILNDTDASDEWKDVLERSRASQRTEMDFMDGADFLQPLRVLDIRRIVKMEYLKGRLTYLKALRSELDAWIPLITEKREARTKESPRS
jgi:hypothetical protein